MRTAAAAATLLALLTIACSGASEGASSGTDSGGQGVGMPAPALRLKRADGGDVDLATLRGRVVLLNFWATWCEPCKAEMPAIESVYRKLVGEGFSVVGVDYRDQEDDLRSFMRRGVVSYPLLEDPSGSSGPTFHLLGVPTSVLLDRDGVVRLVHTGRLTAKRLTAFVTRLLQQPAGTQQLGAKQ